MDEVRGDRGLLFPAGDGIDEGADGHGAADEVFDAEGAEGFDSVDPVKGGGHGTSALAAVGVAAEDAGFDLGFEVGGVVGGHAGEDAVGGAGGRGEEGFGHAVGDEEFGVAAGEGGDLLNKADAAGGG